VILDIALAWACMNRHFAIAAFLLQRGADINPNWSTHEPASLLHECAVNGNYDGAQFLVDHGIEMTIRDYRWNASAEGWARYAAGDQKMAEFLAGSERAENRCGLKAAGRRRGGDTLLVAEQPDFAAERGAAPLTYSCP
jgi:hypothetical protein